MRRNFQTELEELPDTYRAVLKSEAAADVARIVCAHQPMLYVGSGGALAVARLAADLHIRSTGHLAVALTPLDAATARLSETTGLVLFSSRGRNPDAVLAMSAARLRGATHLGIVTSRVRTELPPTLGARRVRVATVPTSPDGFLATNSLLAMAAAVCLAHGVDLPNTLPAFRDETARAIRSSCVVVTGPGTGAVGLDLEARLAETGLATVQRVDYRNLAHGRHVGLQRNADRSTIVAVVDPASEAIADRTMTLLPADLDVLEMRTDLEWPASVLDLFVRSMKVTAATGQSLQVDPGRPGVPSFGRKLYRLPTRKLLDLPKSGPVDRKLTSREAQSPARRGYEDALRTWLARMGQVRFGAVVLDYDGTCCATDDRYSPPAHEVQHEIVRLLDGGLVVGFATGRGKSLHEATRSWLPESFWPQVHVGLYNGSRLLRLDDDPPTSIGASGHLADVADRLDELSLSHGILVERRPTQITVTHDSGQMAGIGLLTLVKSVLARPPMLNAKAVASGHSVDIIDPAAGKTAVLQSVAQEARGATVAIGDQGQVDGNDFEMLAAIESTLSVDRCSEDPTRCWNLDRRGNKGPDLLVRYLRALKIRKSGARFVWRHR